MFIARRAKGSEQLLLTGPSRSPISAPLRVSALFTRNVGTGTSRQPPAEQPAYIWFGTSFTPFLTLKLPHSASKTTFRLSLDKPLSTLSEQIIAESQISQPSLRFVQEDSTALAKTLTARDLFTLTLTKKINLHLNSTLYNLNLPSYTEAVFPIKTKLETLEVQLNALHATKDRLEKTADSLAVRLTWGGLLALCAQWGIMARLTWWDYSWDVMEPISYFLSAGTGIGAYMFYVVTRKEYTYETLHGITYGKKRMALYEKHGFDINMYHQLLDEKKRWTEEIEKLKILYQWNNME